MSARLRGIMLALGLGACAAAGALGATQAAAQAADPTRPPAAYLGVEGTGQAQNPAGQILVISSDRKFATINGERVALGGSYRGAKLVSISEDEVVLKGKGPAEIIRLYASVNKTMRRQPASSEKSAQGGPQ